MSKFYVKSESLRFDRLFPNFDNFKTNWELHRNGQTGGHQWPEVLFGDIAIDVSKPVYQAVEMVSAAKRQ